MARRCLVSALATSNNRRERIDGVIEVINPVGGYVPSKTAPISLTLQYARGLPDEHILVNAVCAGFVATDLTGTFTDDQGPVPW